MIDAGDSLVVQESPRESLFKDPALVNKTKFIDGECRLAKKWI